MGLLSFAFLKKPLYMGLPLQFLGPPEYETMTKGKIFYLKLDLIGQQYTKEYDDHSSKPFQDLCTEIKQEVNIHSVSHQIRVILKEICSNNIT